MTKYTVEVDGMMCGMCEAHVNEAVRKAFAVKKVSSSRAKKQTVVIAEEPIDENALKEAIAATGYTALSVKSEPYQKKGLFHFYGNIQGRCRCTQRTGPSLLAKRQPAAVPWRVKGLSLSVPGEAR